MGDRLRARSPGSSAAWSARLLWEQEAAGSNPASPTTTRERASREGLLNPAPAERAPTQAPRGARRWRRGPVRDMPPLEVDAPARNGSAGLRDAGAHGAEPPTAIRTPRAPGDWRRRGPRARHGAAVVLPRRAGRPPTVTARCRPPVSLAARRLRISLPEGAATHLPGGVPTAEGQIRTSSATARRKGTLIASSCCGDSCSAGRTQKRGARGVGATSETRPPPHSSVPSARPERTQVERVVTSVAGDPAPRRPSSHRSLGSSPPTGRHRGCPGRQGRGSVFDLGSRSVRDRCWQGLPILSRRSYATRVECPLPTSSATTEQARAGGAVDPRARRRRVPRARSPTTARGRSETRGGSSIRPRRGGNRRMALVPRRPQRQSLPEEGPQAPAARVRPQGTEAPGRQQRSLSPNLWPPRCRAGRQPALPYARRTVAEDAAACMFGPGAGATRFMSRLLATKVVTSSGASRWRILRRGARQLSRRFRGPVPRRRTRRHARQGSRTGPTPPGDPSRVGALTQSAPGLARRAPRPP